MVFQETFGQWLKYKRQEKGYSQAFLARKAEMSRATVSLYEKDAILQPRLSQLDKIADILEIGHDEIRSAFASLRITTPRLGENLDTFEIMNGVFVSFDRTKSNLSPAQRDEAVSVLQLVLKGIKQK